QASLGFKNQGQFIAALHVSRNLGIPFADLKTAMTGIRPTTTTGTTGGTTTGTTGGSTGGSTPPTTQTTMSLGQAIKKLRPSANATTATATAEHQATVDATAPKKKNTAPPSRNELTAAPMATSATSATPLAWVDDASLMAPGAVAFSVSAMRWQGGGLSEVDAPIVDAAFGLTP